MTTTSGIPAAEIEPDLLQTYRPSGPAAYDEMMDAHGRVRPHWHRLLAGLSDLTESERESRARHMDRRVRETGIAYDIFADPTKTSQRWQLDLLPIVFSTGEWRWLQAALIQRARIFDAVLTDIYGEQKLLKKGLIPPDLVFADSAFLRPCQSILPRAGALQFYAADLARGADGQWRIIDNHTETLAGIGFALANRVAHTHVTADLFRQNNVVRLASYFQNMQASLTTRCGRDNARIALLTPGPHHEDYFSHAYMARYLGYVLVEGNDLRTRVDRVSLKTLEGLKDVDLIVRCIDGRSSDPLELDPGGFDGPAGLLRVCRQKPNLVVNAIGSAIVQNRGLGPYMPGLAHEMFDEDLHLPDAPRWWLGDPVARDHVLKRIDQFVLRKTQEGTGRPGQAGVGQDTRAMSPAQREIMKREVALHGASLVAEERIGFSTAPAHGPHGLVPQPFALRLFVNRTPDGYEVMPGGLAMTVNPDRAVALNAPDGKTRDVWITADSEQAPHVSLWRPTVEAAHVQRSQRLIQSRVADNLFWLGRYCERADWIMRAIRGALRRIEEDAIGRTSGRDAARKCLEVLLLKEQAPRKANRDPATDSEIETLCGRLIAGSKGMRTLEKTFEGLYRTAHLTRDRLSLDAWQTLSRFRPGDTWTSTLSAANAPAVLDLLDEGLASIAAYNGLMHENMTRNFGWSFMDMGRRLERAYNLSEVVLSLFVPQPTEPDQETRSLLLLLELADSFITYRSRYRLDPMLPLVLDLLLLDDTNPRSLSFQLAAIERHLNELPIGRHGTAIPLDRRLIATLTRSITKADAEIIVRDSQSLGSLMQEQLQVLPQLSNAITQHYFSLIDDAPHRLHTRAEPQP